MPVSSVYPSLLLQTTRHIRLLKIDNGAPEDNISCTLATVSLDDEPSYFALSYCWGPWGDKEKTKIKCNGLTLRATENLIAAMKQLRSTYPSQSFWIDAICINQEDFAERACHVQFMCDIYRLAANVVIYLGEESQGLDRAMVLFRTLHEKSVEPISDSNTAGMIRDSLPRPSDEVWFRLHDFFNRHWFSRMWVIQEVALSSVDPVVLCGSHTLSWSAIAQVARFLRETALTASNIARSRNGNAIMIQQFKERKESLGLLLTTAFHFEASDPRDMVFAFYGIVHPEDRATLSLPYFKVDYEKPVKDVYRDVMMGCLVQYGSVDFMFRGSSPSYHSKIDGLPSWVPDWSIPPQSQTSPIASGPFLSGYNASGGRLAWKGPSENPEILRIVGKSNDKVAWVAEPFQQGDLEVLPYQRRRPQTLEKLWDQVSTRLGESRRTMDAFWRTLMAGVDRKRSPLGPMSYNYFLRFWQQSKHFDQSAIKYWAENPDAAPAQNEVEQRRMFEETAVEESTVVTEDEFDSYKRWCQATANVNLPCRSNGTEDVEATKQNAMQIFATDPPNLAIAAPKCIHCFALVLPEVHRELGTWRIEGTGPALAYRDRDPFIAEYYNHLENGGEAIITSDDKAHILAHLMNVLGNRAFFITRDGKTGLGPWSTQTGDEVVILSGASVPALLRPIGEAVWLRDETNEAYQVVRSIGRKKVIGEAYVHGIMGGEAVENFDWDHDYEVFDLV